MRHRGNRAALWERTCGKSYSCPPSGPGHSHRECVRSRHRRQKRHVPAEGPKLVAHTPKKWGRTIGVPRRPRGAIETRDRRVGTSGRSAGARSATREADTAGHRTLGRPRPGGGRTHAHRRETGLQISRGPSPDQHLYEMAIRVSRRPTTRATIGYRRRGLGRPRKGARASEPLSKPSGKDRLSMFPPSFSPISCTRKVTLASAWLIVIPLHSCPSRRSRSSNSLSVDAVSRATGAGRSALGPAGTGS
ncbi:hypothetical protein F558DRAFT_00222 [Streptomyces sp. AmelKG-A3]|nr:hypothetical protein F558DRAFT_00222 [Streptomyces sp. AmelKG-A3]